MRVFAISAAVASLALASPVLAAATAGNPTMKQCADQWQAMKKAGTAKGSYRDFSKSCLAGKTGATSRTPAQTRMQRVGPQAAPAAARAQGLERRRRGRDRQMQGRRLQPRQGPLRRLLPPRRRGAVAEVGFVSLLEPFWVKCISSVAARAPSGRFAACPPAGGDLGARGRAALGMRFKERQHLAMLADPRGAGLSARTRTW